GVGLSAGSIVVSPTGGELSSVLPARNSPNGPIKQAANDLDSLARSIIEEVNRVHASGAGLTEFSSITSLNAVGSSAAPLTAAGLAFTPVSGSFKVIVHDASGAVTSTVTVAITAGTTSLDGVASAIDANFD